MKSQNIQYAAHQNGLWLNIAGGKRLATHLEFLHNVRLEKKHLKKTANLPDRMRRFKEAEWNLKFTNRLRTIEQVRKEDETEKKQELIAVKGIVRVILNENFGLIWGPIGESDAPEIQYYCLFDTYDLLVSGKQSAADKGMTMSSVVKLGDELIYNACLMDKRKIVPYLATSVWNGVDRAFDVPPMAKANIQSDKVNVYSQVVLSCMPFIEKREREEYTEENEKVEKIEKRAKEEEIKNKAQKLRRKEQEEIKAQELRRKEQEEIKNKAQVIRRKEQQEKERRGDLKNVHKEGTLQEAKMVPYDLVDWRTKGSIEIEKCDLFAILRLWNNEHVLLSTHRVWINDKPKYGGWKPLHLPYFRSQNITARKVEGFEEFQYQAIFSHAGMYKKCGLTFDYPPPTAAWMKPLIQEHTLNAELDIYRTRHGTKKISAMPLNNTVSAKFLSAQKNQDPPPPGTECKQF